MTDEQNNDIEAQAEAAAAAEAEKPEEPRDDAPPPAPDPEPEDKKPAKKKAAKKKAAKRVKDKTPAEKLEPVRSTLKKAQENRVAAAEAQLTDDEKAARDAELEEIAKGTEARLEEVAKICATMQELHGDPDKLDDYNECIEQLRKIAMPGDAAEIVAELHAKADELEEEARNIRRLYADMMNTAPQNDGALHAQRLKAMHARSREIREQRKRDKLKLLAAGAGKSKLDQHLASRPRTSPADADKPADNAQE